MDIEAVAGGGDLFAEEDGAAIAERGEAAELVAGVCLGERLRSGRDGIAGEDAESSPSSAARERLKMTRRGVRTGTGAWATWKMGGSEA